jgi:hypothetical protein
MKLRQPAGSGANSGRHVLEDEAGKTLNASITRLFL